jgi:predicted secreted hydrolase
MDREWSTSALEPEQAGWDWFALQLADGRELMYYRMRRKDGAADPHSRGVIIDADGGRHAVSPEDIRITVTAHWQSPRSGARYPAGWMLELPDHGLRLRVTPYVADQELSGRLRYWEGAVRVEDGEGRAAGSGYVELVGYAPP